MIASSDKTEVADEGEKPPPIDWGEIYAKLLDVGLRYDEIPQRTFPQIQALLGGRDKNIVEKMISVPNIFGTPNNLPASSPTTKQESTQEDVEAFFNSF